MDAGYLVIVIPADGWGSPWYEMYRTLDNAEQRVKELAKKYGMELMYWGGGLEAERFENFDRQHYLAQITTEHLYYDDWKSKARGEPTHNLHTPCRRRIWRNCEVRFLLDSPLWEEYIINCQEGKAKPEGLTQKLLTGR